MFEMLLVTYDELWSIHDYVRQTDKHGLEWDKAFAIRVFEAMAATLESANRQTSMLVYEEELWQIDRQVPSALMSGTQPVGRNLLLKVGKLLVKYQKADKEAQDG